LSLALIALIALNVIVSVLETEPSIERLAPRLFVAFEIISVMIFTIEYLARLWASAEDPTHGGGWRGRLRWLASPMALVDLLAILPFYLSFGGVDLRMLRALRLFRVFRVFKLGRYSDSFDLLSRVWKRTRADLALGSLVALLVVLLSSSAMWLIENDLQPETFGSIPQSMWWGIITATTIGYGDVSPLSPLGKVVGGVIAYIGVCTFALPVGVVGAAFVDEIQERRKRIGAKAQARAAYADPNAALHALTCPHCKQAIHPDDLLDQLDPDDEDQDKASHQA
jgi:voltage-gated potassium channel